MKKLPKRLSRKIEIYRKYVEELSLVKEIKLFDHNTSHTVPWFIDCLAQDRDKLIDFLETNRIGSRKMYPPINKQKAYLVSGNHPISEKIGLNGLWLPSSIQLTDEEIIKICSTIKLFYKDNKN